jgi:hypothetical protein
MLSLRNELILVGLLIFYLAFIPSLQMIRDMLATPIGKAAALAGIVYVYKYVSCPAALLLVIAYVRCARMTREMFDVPPMMTCPDGTALDSTATPPVCRSTSSVTASSAPSPTESGMGASVSTPPPNSSMSTAPMTTPTATMPPMSPSNTSGGVQPSSGSSSSVSPL